MEKEKKRRLLCSMLWKEIGERERTARTLQETYTQRGTWLYTKLYTNQQ
jgi:hypothetical protein